MVSITIHTDFRDFNRWYKRKLGRLHTDLEGFLRREKSAIERHVRFTVYNSVYAVPFVPLKYKRTMNLLNSMRVYFPDNTNPYLLYINSDPDVARAVLGGGGYAKYVAGEGPGIGFLKRMYTGPGGSIRPSFFPRKWHLFVAYGSSPIYNAGLARGIQQKLEELINRRTN